MKEIKANLTAGTSVSFAVRGNYFRVLNADAPVKISIDDLSIASSINEGIGISTGDFNELRLLSDVNQTVVFVVAHGRVDDSRLYGSINAKNQGVSAYSAPAVVALAAGVAKEVLPVKLDRFRAMVQSVGDIYIGADATVTAANGILLAGNSLLTVDNTAALWAISAAAVDVRIVEEE